MKRIYGFLVALAATAAAAYVPGSDPGDAGAAAGGYTPTDRSSAYEFKEPGWLFNRPSGETPAEQLALADGLKARKKWKAACGAYNALVKEWGASPEASAAQLGVACMQEMRRNFEEAFREYQYYIDYYATTAPAAECSFQDVIDSQFAVANELRARLGGTWSSPGTELVASMFRRIAANAPDGPRAPECVFYEALSYEQGGYDRKAVPVYERLAARHPGHELAPEALYRAAFCRCRLSDRAPNDERGAVNALEALRLAIRSDPASAHAEEAGKLVIRFSDGIAGAAFERAEFYEKIRCDGAAALAAYREFLRKYPASAHSDRARERIAALEAAESAEKEAGK